MIDLVAHVSVPLLCKMEAHIIIVDKEVRAALEDGLIAEGKIVKVCGRRKRIVSIAGFYPITNYDGTPGQLIGINCKDALIDEDENRAATA